ncbi:GNAT family N-acetyltransferase [Schlesneria paludicola]|uniref:GNAT family N-acetyltransferase n=1 Tax=Schlesneria paludicola TaxID=360056 RepID=UPI0012F73ADC|nr:GNAT family N-acetyltransferase [Schlesneria paludicola]
MTAEADGQVVGAALLMHQLDGVTLVWPPVVSCQAPAPAAVEDALMTRMCDEIDRTDSRLAQILLAPGDTAETELIARFGFEHLADLCFMARTLSADDVALSPNDGELEFDTFDDSRADRFASVIERSYQDSLDCPFLDGFRNGRAALVSHRLSGQFDPAGWRLYRQGADDIGITLTNEHPEQNAIELVYFGIVPEFRGQGFGRRILSDSVQAAAFTGRSTMFLAVDCGNIYANNLYGELNFTEVARRQAMVRRSARVARE